MSAIGANETRALVTIVAAILATRTDAARPTVAKLVSDAEEIVLHVAERWPNWEEKPGIPDPPNPATTVR